MAFVAMLGGNIALAFGPWLVRLADVGPVAAGFWRMILALPLLYLLTRMARQPIPRIPGALWLTLALGALFFAGDLGAWHVGILRTRLANATLFGNAATFVYPAYGFIVARRMPGRNQGSALLLALVGMALLLGRSYELSPRNFAGDLFCLAAGGLYVGYLIAVQRARDHLQPLPILFCSTVFGVAPLLFFAVLLGEQVMPHNWGPLLLLAIGSQVVGQGLLVYAIGALPPVVVGIGFLIQPVVSAAIGWIAYDERLNGGDMIGAAVVAIALVLVRRPERAAPPLA
jgi:drug/metabolite transporter (DMT)-like permease